MKERLDLEVIKARLEKRRIPQIGRCKACGAEQEIPRFGAFAMVTNSTPFDPAPCSICGQSLVVTFTVTMNSDEPSADEDIKSLVAVIAGVLEIVRRWRWTADVWERQLTETYGQAVGPRADTEQQPPEYGRLAIRNWINWLRAQADEIEFAEVTDQPEPTP